MQAQVTSISGLSLPVEDAAVPIRAVISTCSNEYSLSSISVRMKSLSRCKIISRFLSFIRLEFKSANCRILLRMFLFLSRMYDLVIHLAIASTSATAESSRHQPINLISLSVNSRGFRNFFSNEITTPGVGLGIANWISNRFHIAGPNMHPSFVVPIVNPLFFRLSKPCKNALILLFASSASWGSSRSFTKTSRLSSNNTQLYRLAKKKRLAIFLDVSPATGDIRFSNPADTTGRPICFAIHWARWVLPVPGAPWTRNELEGQVFILTSVSNLAHSMTTA